MPEASVVRRRVLRFTGTLHKEGDIWLAEEARLPIASFGTTPEEAMRRVVEALSFYLEALRKRGVLDDTLRQHGIVPEESGEITFSIETPAPEEAGALVSG